MRNDWRLGCIGCWLKRYRRDQPYRNHHVIHTVAQKSNSVFELCRGSDTPVWISVPKREKWFFNASVSTTASWRLSKMIAVSSAYSESSNETGSPRALNDLPVIFVHEYTWCGRTCYSPTTDDRCDEECEEHAGPKHHLVWHRYCY